MFLLKEMVGLSTRRYMRDVIRPIFAVAIISIIPSPYRSLYFTTNIFSFSDFNCGWNCVGFNGCSICGYDKSGALYYIG